jgi:hypothetical protein
MRILVFDLWSLRSPSHRKEVEDTTAADLSSGTEDILCVEKVALDAELDEADLEGKELE